MEALSIQMYVARLTGNQVKFLVRIRPHLSGSKGAERSNSDTRRIGSFTRTTIRSTGGPRTDWNRDVRKLPKGKEKGKKDDDDD